MGYFTPEYFTPVGVQCPLTASVGEFPGYWDWLRYPGLSPVLVSIAIPFAFHMLVYFPFTLLQLPLDFLCLFFTVAVSALRHQPSPLPGLGTGTGPQRTLRRNKLLPVLNRTFIDEIIH